jgi:hypothetical protein
VTSGRASHSYTGQLEQSYSELAVTHSTEGAACTTGSHGACPDMPYGNEAPPTEASHDVVVAQKRLSSSSQDAACSKSQHELP